MEIAIHFWLSLSVGFLVTTLIAGLLSELIHKLQHWHQHHEPISPSKRWHHL